MEGTDPEDQMLLTSSSHKIVAHSLEVPELSAEVERAVYQVQASLDRAKTLEEEKHKLEADQAEQEKEQEQQRRS